MGKSSPRLERWGLFVGILAVYLLLPTRKYYWDGISFAQIIEDAPRLHPNLIHPNHLLYNVFGYLIYQLIGLSGTIVRAITVLQVANILLSVICAYIFFQILKSVFSSRYLNYCLTLLFSFSATWWQFSTDVDSYILTTLWLLICFYLILPGQKPRPVLVAIIHTLGMFFHQLAVLFFPVVLLGIYFQASAQTRKQRGVLMARYLTVASSMTLAAYYLCFYLREGSSNLQAFVRWTLAYQIPAYPTENFTFNLWNNLGATLHGQLKLFLGTSGRLPWTISMKNPVMVALFVVLIAAVAVFCFKLAQDLGHSRTFIRTAIRGTDKLKPLLAMSVTWCAVYILFLFFFRPQDTFHRLVYLPALILILGVIITRLMNSAGYRRRYRTALAVLIVAVFNLIFLIFPYSKIQGNPPLEFALKMNQNWSQQTVIYYADLNGDDMIVKYFNPQITWRPLNTDINTNDVRDSDLQGIYISGGTAWINTATLDFLNSRPDGKVWLQGHTKEEFKFELVNNKHRIQYFQIFPQTLNNTMSNNSLEPDSQ